MQKEIQNLIDNPAMIREALNTDQLDRLIRKVAMIHGQTIILNHKVGICRYNGNPLLRVWSDQNLVDACGIFACAITACRLESANSGIAYTEEKGLTAWVTMDLKFDLFDVGSNGMEIATFWFENGEWRISRGKDIQ